METIEPLLKAHPFFKNLEPEHVSLMVGCASNVVFEPNQYIFREGEEANTFYVVRYGRVSVQMYSPEKGSINIQTCNDGDVLGWSWLVPPYRWRFDAKVIEKSRLIALNGKCLREKCEKDSNLGYKMMRVFAEMIAERLEATRLQLLDIYK